MPFFSIPVFVYFIPFLIICFYKHSLGGCLWWSLACGCIVDLFSGEERMGTFAFNFCATSFCLYRYKFFFFEDRPSTIPLLCLAFSFINQFIQVLTSYAFGRPVPFAYDWIFDVFLIIPLQVSLFAFIFFTLPSLIFSRAKKTRTA